MGHWGESAIWFGLACLSAGLFTFAVEPWLRGRLPTDAYHAYLRSDEWAAKTARLAATRRGRRCAACGMTDDLHVHHASYRCLGYESLWQLVRLCSRHHQATHTASEWIFSSRTRGLWFSTALIVGYGKLGQVFKPRARLSA